MGDIEAPAENPAQPEKDDYYAYMNHPNYKPRVETEPTPLRSDTFHSLMKPEVAARVFARYERGKAIDPYQDRPMTELEKEIFDNPTLGTAPQKEQIVTASNQELMDYRQEEAFRLFKSRTFYFCFFMSMFGVLLMLYGLSATVIFERYDENPAAFYCSFVLFLPGVWWVIYAYFPCTQEETERRRRMSRARRWRNHLKAVQKSYFFGHEDSDEEDFQKFEKKKAREERKSVRESGSFRSGDESRRSAKVSTVVPVGGGGTGGGGGGKAAAGSSVPAGRLSVELPSRAPVRSSLKIAPSEKKASVQFKLDTKK